MFKAQVFTSIRCQHFFITKLSQQQWSQYMKLSTNLFHSISTQNISAGLSMQQWGMWSWPTLLTNDQTQKSKQKNVHFLYCKLSALTSRNIVIYTSWCSIVWNKSSRIRLRGRGQGQGQQCSRPRPRPLAFQAKAKAAIFGPRAVLEVEDSPRGPHPWFMNSHLWTVCRGPGSAPDTQCSTNKYGTTFTSYANNYVLYIDCCHRHYTLTLHFVLDSLLPSGVLDDKHTI